MREEFERWDYPGSNPSQGNLITVQYNEDWLPIVSGIFARIDSAAQWQNAPDDIEAQVRELQYMLETPVTIPNPPITQTLFPPSAHLEVGGSASFTYDTNAILNAYWKRDTPQQYDGWLWRTALPAGDFQLELLWHRYTTLGIATLSVLPSGESMTIDMYGSALYNQKSILSFTQAEMGTCDIQLNMLSKNTLSGGYQARLGYIAIRPG